MTLQEAIMDKNRPLSVPPQQWMQYEQAKEYEEQQVIENQIKRIVAVEQNQDDEDISNINVDSEQKLQISIEKMILGCRMSMKVLQELDRKNATPSQREFYNTTKNIINNAIAPYLADILKARKKLYKGEE